MQISWRAAPLAVIVVAVQPALADVVAVVDPPGLGEIEEEIGNISKLAFEALGPVVQDHENGTGPQGADVPFMLGGVNVTGEYGLGDPGTGAGSGNPWVLANLSGNRGSFTESGVDALMNPAGNWFYADVDPNDARNNRVLFNFAAPSAEVVTAVCVAWVGRDNRGADSILTATVTFADAATMSETIEIDSTGDGLPNGKDVFIGFQDDGDHGGIVSLAVISAQTFQAFHYFQGWDDIGVVTMPAGPATEEVQVTIDLQSMVDAGPFSRCISMEFIDTDLGSSVVSGPITFAAGTSGPVMVTVPSEIGGMPARYDCLVLRDEHHSLARRVTPTILPLGGLAFEATADAGLELRGGNLNGDGFIDVLDFGAMVVAGLFEPADIDTDCSTPQPHGDITGDGLTDLSDVAFIAINFLQFGDGPCGDAALHGPPARPTFEIALGELRRSGRGALAAADLNQDGILDLLDLITAFAGPPDPPARARPVDARYPD